MVPGDMPIKWKSFVVFDSKRILAGGPKCKIILVEMRWPRYALLRIIFNTI